MTTKSIQSSNLTSAVMIGAGLCAAVLFTLLRQGTPQALALAHLTPLPIMISALGFGPSIGLGSAAFATLCVALLAIVHEGVLSSTTIMTGFTMGLIFMVTEALPAWWLGFLSCLSRVEDSGRWRIPPLSKTAKPFTHYPIGDILVHAAVVVICVICLLGAMVTIGYGGFDATIDQVKAELLPQVQKLTDAQTELSGSNVENITQLTIKLAPAFVAGWYLTIFIANLWLAGRIALISNRLRRPWPDIARDLSLPRPLVVALAIAVGLCFVKSWPGAIGLIAAVVFVLIYALQGLAVVHSLSRGSKWRGLILLCVYATLMFSTILSLALLGLADTAFSLRERKAAALLASKP
jgi:hypothetical protein